MIGRAEVHVFRGDHLESRHQVVGALADPSGALLGSCGREAIDEPVFLRSTAKPFQAAAVVASGAADRFAFADDE
ncbi:MAG: L-asparaginase, partial [Candidatus Binatota bacterium]|nr:L-asparaginase [Candidatus Binatota bacterium]